MKELLKSLSTRDQYYRFNKYIKSHVLSKEHSVVFKDMDTYFTNNKDIDGINWEAFNTWALSVQHPMYDAIKSDLYSRVVNAISNSDAAKAEDIIESFITRDFATRIAEESLRISEGGSDSLDDVLALIELYNTEAARATKQEDVDVAFDIASLADDVYGGNGLDWRLSFLNRAIGPLRKGNLVVFSARPDSGKTTFLASEATYLARSMEPEQSVLWVNNEEAGHSVAFRLFQAALQRDSKNIMANLPKAQADYDAIMGRRDRIIFKDKPGATVYDVDKWADEVQPGLIIFDQLWKMHGFEKGAGNEVQRQTAIFNWARELAKKHAPVITVHQADGTAEGQKWLDMSQLYGTKTGAQGEADVILMMGKSHKNGEENTRYLSVVKNKLPGSPNTNPAMRQGKSEIAIVPHLATFREM